MKRREMMTEEQIIARLQAARLDRPRPAPPKPEVKPEAKAQEHWDKDLRQTIAKNAAVSAEAFAQVVQEDTYEARRRKQEAKETAQWVAEGQDPRVRYQRELDRFMEASRVIEAEYVEIAGFREPRYRATCHRGKGDPDYGL